MEEALSRFAKAGCNSQAVITDLRALYRQEVEQRRRLYNTLIEIRGNIRVYCRIRPNLEAGSGQELLYYPAEGTLAARLPNAAQRQFQFDRNFNASTRQEEVCFFDMRF